MSHHIVSNSGNITFVINNRSYVVSPSHRNYDVIKSKLSAPDKELLDLIDIPASIQKSFNHTQDGVTVENGEVLYNGEAIHNSLTERILKMINDGFDVSSMLKFLGNLMLNPSYKSRQELYDFLADSTNLPITEEGHFLAYKSVDSQYLSKHENNLKLLQGKIVNNRIYNGIGEVIECRRHDVDDNSQNNCSQGLHVGGLSYSGPGGSYHTPTNKVVIVSVNPADAVSVPSDHSAGKLRVCKYKVVGEYESPLNQAPVYTETGIPAPKRPAFEKGKQDFAYGLDLGDNPYKAYTEEKLHADWEEGYLYAEHEFEEDEDYDDDDDDDDDVDFDCDCGNSDCEYGTKPNGQKYYNGRDENGRFKKKD